jgi:protein SCO1
VSEMIQRILGLGLATALALSAAPGLGQGSSGTPASIAPPELEGVGFEQRLDEQVDFELTFRDSTGDEIRLGELFGEKPAVLALAYYECPMLCTLELNGVLRALRAMRESDGEEFNVVTVSFDPGEGPELAAEKKKHYLEQYRRVSGESGWRFLTGSEESIRSLADAVGFRYRYDEETDLYRHASGIVVLTPGGRVSRYFFGVEYSARDLRWGLIEASEGRIGDVVDAAMLYCFHYDPTTGKYGVVVMNALRLGGGLTVLALALFMGIGFWRDRRRGMLRTPSDAAGARG